jgi:hypothetical protein
MTVEELRSILKYSEIEPNKPVRITVHKSSGTRTTVDVDNFNIYSDCFIINVNVDNEL